MAINISGTRLYNFYLQTGIAETASCFQVESRVSEYSSYEHHVVFGNKQTIARLEIKRDSVRIIDIYRYSVTSSQKTTIKEHNGYIYHMSNYEDLFKVGELAIHFHRYKKSWTIQDLAVECNDVVDMLLGGSIPNFATLAMVDGTIPFRGYYNLRDFHLDDAFALTGKIVENTHFQKVSNEVSPIRRDWNERT